jgi:hypothetical protein
MSAEHKGKDLPKHQVDERSADNESEQAPKPPGCVLRTAPGATSVQNSPHGLCDLPATQKTQEPARGATP